MEKTFVLPERLVLTSSQLDGSERREDQGTSSKGLPWTEGEHLNFLQGLRVFGKGKWRQISRVFLNKKKTPTQVASHAQKYFARLQGTTKRKSRFTSLEEKATRTFPVAASDAVQALQSLSRAQYMAVPASAGAPACFYVPLHIEPLHTPVLPEPALAVANQCLAKLYNPAARTSSSQGSDCASLQSCDTQGSPTMHASAQSALYMPAQAAVAV